jgi:hypothetical protein
MRSVVQFALINTSKVAIKTLDVAYGLTSLLPEEEINIAFSYAMKDVPVGIYKLGVRIICHGSRVFPTIFWS